MFTRLKKPSLGMALAAMAFLAACGDNEEPLYVETPVEGLYNQALDSLADGNNTEAARLFDEVERQHPYSVWSSKAQLMAAYSSYRAKNYNDAINASDRFIQLHPGNRDIAYAYYLRALSFYDQIVDVGRDQAMTRNALEALDEVVRRFPDTQYAKDAQLKLDLTRDHLAGKHMSIGRFYIRRQDYLAAINRFRTVVDRYQTTTHVPEALHRLTESYLAIGLGEEAKKTAAVLGYNYPGSDWYEDSYRLLVDDGLAKAGDADKPWWDIF
ncbi:outer membrane protein assembly factor BamD [Pararhizobium sp.]|uniref:outer membrane protein assembly factor BamD n=1 Tax=Pararhizobium sp. TaxID=1977563 RepID=UPI003D1448AF